MTPRAKSLVPTVLAATGAALLIGCVPLPGRYKLKGGQPRPESYIGNASTRKPVRVAESTSAGVRALLGPADASTPDGRVLVYYYRVDTLYWFSPLCPGGYLDNDMRKYEQRFLLLRFGRDDKLESFKVYKDPRAMARAAGGELRAEDASEGEAGWRMGVPPGN
jgi:hypothetical protein